MFYLLGFYGYLKSQATVKRLQIFIDLHVKCQIFLPNFNQIWIFLTDFFIRVPNTNFIVIRPVGATLMYDDRRTDMKKIMDAFRN